MNPDTPAVLLFLKAPVRGMVKTRLAEAIGEDAALALYRAMGRGQLDRLPPGWRREVHFSPAGTVGLVRDWLGNHVCCYPQVSGDLGARLEAGFAGAFGRGAPMVCAIGGDCPGLVARHFQEARAVLESQQADVVFGPTEDGGYYLVALREPLPALFRGIPWSCEQTLAASIQAAKSLGKVVHLLQPLADVDTLEDLRNCGMEEQILHKVAERLR